ncbi:MAG: amidophosphoribosyltransferase [Planctomycetota bacterium]
MSLPRAAPYRRQIPAMCGFIGIMGPPETEAFREIHDGLTAIQHRGQDAAGIVTFDGRFNMKKGLGLVREVFGEKHVERLRGSMGLGHVRYPTIGGGETDDAQPFLVNSPVGVAMVHNGNLTNFDELKRWLGDEGLRHVNSSCDVEVILNVFAEGLERQPLRGQPTPEDIFAAVAGLFEKATGAYSVVGLVGGRYLVAFRDPYGIKPIIMGERRVANGTGYCVASESVVLDLLDYHNTRNIRAGEVVVIERGGRVFQKQIAHKTHQPCLFEWVYFARPDSFLDRVSVYKTRVRLGEMLADLWRGTGLSADVIIPVPESAITAAQAMAHQLGIRFSEALVKNRYIGRTFIMPSDRARTESIRHKLNPIQIEFENRDVLLVDDSIVRGNTSRQIVQLAREAGARRVYFASYSPPLRFPCVYGIDMSTRAEFIARGRTAEEVAKLIGADFVLYQTLPNLETAVGRGNPELQRFCNACFTGSYPTGDVTPEMLRAIEEERLAAQGRAAERAV